MHPSESPPTPALPGKSLAGLRGGGGPAAGPAPPGSQSGLCLRQPGAQRSHRGPGLGLARADSGPGAGPGKERGTKAPEGAGPRPRRDTEHSSGYSWLSVPESKKWGSRSSCQFGQGLSSSSWSGWTLGPGPLLFECRGISFHHPPLSYTHSSGTNLRVPLSIQYSVRESLFLTECLRPDVGKGTLPCV